MNYKIVLIIFAVLFWGCKKDESPTDPGGGGDNTGTVAYEGKTYKTVKIGNQVWMAENLNVGTRIDSRVNNQPNDQSNNSIIEKYCYDDLESNCDKYGGLYQWDEAMQYSTTPGSQGICPPGWHIPTRAEFETLRATVNSDGNALKSVGEGSGVGAGTNTSGFSALLSGSRNSSGYFISLGTYANFWSTPVSTTGTGGTNILTLLYDGSDIGIGEIIKSYGFSVRCVKD